MGHNILNEIRLLRKEHYNTEIYILRKPIFGKVFSSMKIVENFTNIASVVKWIYGISCKLNFCIRVVRARGSEGYELIFEEFEQSQPIISQKNN